MKVWARMTGMYEERDRDDRGREGVSERVIEEM